jgi:hypothetical protein
MYTQRDVLCCVVISLGIDFIHLFLLHEQFLEYCFVLGVDDPSALLFSVSVFVFMAVHLECHSAVITLDRKRSILHIIESQHLLR